MGDALDMVAAELKRVRDSYGATAIFGGSYGWSSAGRLHHARTLVRRFLALGGGFVDQAGNYSWGAAQFLLPHVIGTFQPVSGQVTDWPSIVGHTKLMIAFGGLALKNGQVSSGGTGAHVLESWLKRARANGAAFVVISPNRSDVPDGIGAEWIAIRPNTDTAMMLGMAHVLVTERRHDRDFLACYCTGFEVFQRYLMGETDGVAKTPEWAAQICGVPAETIASSRPTRRFFAKPHHLRLVVAARPSWRAALLGVDCARRYAGRHRSSGGRLCLRPWLDERRRGAARRCAGAGVRHSAQSGAHASFRSPAWPTCCCIPASPTSSTAGAAVYPDIQLIYWAGGNPFHHHQDLNRLRRAGRSRTPSSCMTAGGRRPRVAPISCCQRRRRSSATTSGGSSRDPYLFAMHQAIDAGRRGQKRFRYFPRLGQRLGYEAGLHRRPRRNGLVPARSMIASAPGAADRGVDLPGFQQFWAEGFVELPKPDARFRVVRGLPPPIRNAIR